jgi:hypothetical protein
MMENQKSANQWADFWRYEVGVNVIPALNKIKTPKVEWKNSPLGNWQSDPIPENIHTQWKNQNLFDEGLAIVTGKVFHNEQFKGMWLNGIDCDNKAGTDVMCPSGVAHIAKGTLVEQHDNPDKCHILFYTDEPLKNRAINQNSEYQIEVKSMGRHLLYCAGGYHKDGSLIDIVGTTNVKIAEKDSMEKMLDEHLGTAKTSTILDTVESEVKYLHDPNLKKTKGDGGGLDLLRVLDSWKIKNPEYTEKMLLALAIEYTNEHHDPVCSDEKVRGLVKQAMGFGEKIIAENSEIEKNQFTGDERINNATDQIQGDHSFVTMEKSEKLLMWTGKIYSESKARKTIKEITEQLIPNCTEHDRIEVINKIKARTYTDIDDFDSDPNVITTENGILTLDTLELIPHTPDNLTMVLLPVEYHTPKFEIHDENIFDDVEKNLKDTLFYKSLKLCFTINDTFREQDFQTVLEMLSSVFVKRHIDSKAFMNLGSGENGKSVFLGYIESLLGNDNVSHIPLQDMQTLLVNLPIFLLI